MQILTKSNNHLITCTQSSYLRQGKTRATCKFKIMGYVGRKKLDAFVDDIR